MYEVLPPLYPTPISEIEERLSTFVLDLLSQQNSETGQGPEGIDRFTRILARAVWEYGKRIPALSEGEYQEAFTRAHLHCQKHWFHESHDCLLRNADSLGKQFMILALFCIRMVELLRTWCCQHVCCSLPRYKMAIN